MLLILDSKRLMRNAMPLKLGVTHPNRDGSQQDQQLKPCGPPRQACNGTKAHATEACEVPFITILLLKPFTAVATVLPTPGPAEGGSMKAYQNSSGRSRRRRNLGWLCKHRQGSQCCVSVTHARYQSKDGSCKWLSN